MLHKAARAYVMNKMLQKKLSWISGLAHWWIIKGAISSVLLYCCCRAGGRTVMKGTAWQRPQVVGTGIRLVVLKSQGIRSISGGPDPDPELEPDPVPDFVQAGVLAGMQRACAGCY